jgi:hypothetical protein
MAFVCAVAITIEAAMQKEGQPHIEHREVPMPFESQGFGLASRAKVEPLSHLRQRLLYALTHHASLAKSHQAMLEAFGNTARQMLAIRTLQLWERQITYQMLAAEIRTIRLRTRRDHRAALPAIASALALQPPPKLSFVV